MPHSSRYHSSVSVQCPPCRVASVPSSAASPSPVGKVHCPFFEASASMLWLGYHFDLPFLHRLPQRRALQARGTQGGERA
jgi:hypothetical protein